MEPDRFSEPIGTLERDDVLAIVIIVICICTPVWWLMGKLIGTV